MKICSLVLTFVLGGCLAEEMALPQTTSSKETPQASQQLSSNLDQLMISLVKSYGQKADYLSRFGVPQRTEKIYYDNLEGVEVMSIDYFWNYTFRSSQGAPEFYYYDYQVLVTDGLVDGVLVGPVTGTGRLYDTGRLTITQVLSILGLEDKATFRYAPIGTDWEVYGCYFDDNRSVIVSGYETSTAPVKVDKKVDFSTGKTTAQVTRNSGYKPSMTRVTKIYIGPKRNHFYNNGRKEVTVALPGKLLPDVQ